MGSLNFSNPPNRRIMALGCWMLFIVAHSVWTIMFQPAGSRCTQRLQYPLIKEYTLNYSKTLNPKPLIKEYTLNYSRIPNMILRKYSLIKGGLESLGS